MADVSTLLAEFVAADRRGEAPDPPAYLDRTAGAAERAELLDRIDAYLARAPRRPYDAAAAATGPARAVAGDLARALGGQAGLWPAVLPRLRHRAQLKRAQLVERLAAELGASAQREKVGAYYHAMERGTLPAAGVSDRVLEALGRIVGEGAAALRDAGRGLARGAGEAPDAAVVFARTARPDPAYADDEDEPEAAAPAPAPGERDAVDELFTGASAERP